MNFRTTTIRTLATVLAALSYITAAKLAHGANDAGMTCTRTTTIRADGAIVTHTVCERPAHRAAH